MTDKERIRNEINRLKDKNREAFDCGCDGEKCAGYDMALDDILSFIDSIPKEPVGDDLKQAAVDAFKKVVNDGQNSYFNIFKAGADWKEQKLMQDAVDGVVYNNPTWPGNVVGNLPFYSHFKQHEHVKLIIIRKNEL